MSDTIIFHKSSYSHLDCVEAAPLPDGSVELRDSKDPDGPRQTFTRREWIAFVAAVKEGEFDFGMNIADEKAVLAGMR